jgi:hypothetical protein
VIWTELTQSFSLFQPDGEVKAVTPSGGKKVNIALNKNSAQGGNKVKLPEYNSCL